MAITNQTPLIGQIDQDEQQQRRKPAVQQDSAGIGRMTAGALSLPVAAVRDGLGNIGTDIANVGRMAIGGEPVPRPGYGRTAALAQQTADGAAAFAGANRSLLDNTKAALRDATGTRAAAPSAQAIPSIGQGMPALASAQAPGTAGSITPQRIQGMARDAASRPATSQQVPAIGDIGAGNGYTQAGNGIAMRAGADGVSEFTNEASAVSGARAMPAGGVGRVGDGIGGGLSVGEPGDAARAIQSFDRANQIRGEMIRENRRGQIGEGGGRVTIVRDSSRSPSLADMQNDRRDARQAETALRNQQAQQGILSGLDERMTSQLQRQRLGQEIEQGDLATQDQRRVQALRNSIGDINLDPNQRAAARQSYNALSIDPTAQLKAEREAGSQQQKMIGDLYKAYSGLQERPMTGPEGSRREVPFDEWLQPALQAIQGSSGGGTPAGVSKESAIAQAKQAVASGISREAINKRLAQWGIEPI